MALTRPQVGDDVSAELFGQPVYDSLMHLPGRVWRNALTTINLTGWMTIPGSNIAPTETLARRWVCIFTVVVGAGETAHDGFLQWNVNGNPVNQYQMSIARGSQAFTFMSAVPTPTAIATTDLTGVQFNLANGTMVLIDGGP